ncbi:hypothetical protein RJ639_021771 [Escallonia herrerae]|uniref:BHLH domain-containing protein n=1 Tax=Escallonia herrerae TaxID=1293975 RepID=A0AA89AH04_9ASTE|nr:hypothetical protein RJ639_021771 [Escallonia herrerae]
MLVSPEMYEEDSACFDPTNHMQKSPAEVGYSQNHVPDYNPSFPMTELSSYHQNPPQNIASTAATAAMEEELQQQLCLEMDQSNWDTSGYSQYHHHQQQEENIIETPIYPPTPDLLNLFHLPRCSNTSNLIPNSSSLSFKNLIHDPLLGLNLPNPQPPMFRGLFQSLPHGYNLASTTNNIASLFGGVEEREAPVLYQDGEGSFYDNDDVFEFNREMNFMAKGKNGKNTKHYVTEKQRRVTWNDKYKVLKELVPNPTKDDRASILADAINYIKELLRTVDELKILVEKKRSSRETMKNRYKVEDGSALEVDSSNMKQVHNWSLRSSWLQRKSKNTEVDVRIIDDEVTIKLVQQKRVNCLLLVSKMLDEFQLDLHHVGGGLIGDYYSYLFNTKICEGSSVYATAVANKLIESVDTQYAAIPPTSSY